ncbi:MAG: hypothetical protein MSC31_19190 [Solirubrobacteraceae bacterium MAG38_C4-C5]|nr:hypothetical protein [Candidatus Siliceabacter maunaloa]
MTAWEYTTTVITHGFMGRQSDELDREKFQEELSRSGPRMGARHRLTRRQPA